jgi:hypothetical protein
MEDDNTEKEYWMEISKDNRSMVRIAREIGVCDATIYRKFKRYGIKKVPTKLSEETKRKMSNAHPKGDNHDKWKGNDVSYKKLHIWVKKNKIKPEVCEGCKVNLPYDLSNISGKYKRDVNDFKWLCRSCHMKEDGRIKNLLRGGNNKRDKSGRFVKKDGKEED